jgi:hypothetical protein
MSEYILQVLAQPKSETESVIKGLCENGILSAISALICELGPSVPPCVVVVLAQIILTFQKPTGILISQATEILNSVFSIESASETALIIASHLARISKDFLPSLAECGALNIAERALQSDVVQIRAKGLDFIGNVCRHTALPEEYEDAILPLLVANLSDSEPVLQRLSAFALGNILLWSSDASTIVMSSVSTFPTLLKKGDAKTAENTAGLLGNLVRNSGEYISKLIKHGVIEALVNTLERFPELDGKQIFALASFCQYDEARKYLKTINSDQLIAKYTNSTNERVKRYSRNILSSLN